MGLEIEKKFLVGGAPPFSLADWEKQEIRQGYLAVMADGTEVRIRQKGENCFQTIKKGKGEERLETEIIISSEQFAALWPLTEGCRVRKTRYRIFAGKECWELDVFHDELEGLRLVEVEFPSRERSRAFVPPAWFGREVTADQRYKNQQLAVQGRPEVGG